MTAQTHTFPHVTVRPDWLDTTREEIIEPGLPIIDPHHHLWHDRPSGRYMPEQLFADLNSGHDIRATVFAQCAWQHRTEGPEDLRSAGETEAVAAVAVLSATGAYGPARACAGIFSFADLRSPRLDAALDAHVAAGGGHFRGIRQIAATHPTIQTTSSTPIDPTLMQDPAFAQGLRRLGERGFTFDSWAYHTQLHDLLAVVRAAPGTTVVIDHVGGPIGAGPYRGKRDDEVFPDWKRDMAALAACPNTVVKLGGLAMAVNGFDYHTADVAPSSERIAADWRPWIDTCITLFGAGRCMFESNFPVDKGMCSYPVLWNAFKRLAAGASADEKAALFFGTANRTYKLGL